MDSILFSRDLALLLEDQSCNIVGSSLYSWISLIETSLVLGVYTCAMLWVLYHVGRSLGKQAYITIMIFFVCELASLIVYIIYTA